jgi:hypothetical protein
MEFVQWCIIADALAESLRNSALWTYYRQSGHFAVNERIALLSVDHGTECFARRDQHPASL